VDFVLRAASPADAGELVALWQEAAENSSRPPDTAGAVTALLGRDPEAVMLAEHDGVLIGRLPAAGRLAPLGEGAVTGLLLAGLAPAGAAQAHRGER
jgi:urease accessory protein UreF